MTITADNRPPQQDREGQPLKGITGTRLYSIWTSMHARCYYPNAINYQDYGGKGITVCEEWHKDNPEGFYNFREWAIQNGYNEDLTLDRIDSNGDYTPMNCQWATMKEQNRNRSMNRPVIVNGTTYRTLSEACEALGREEDYRTIQRRIKHGWTAQRAFDTPIKGLECNNHPVTVNGITFPSIKEACRALKLNQTTVCMYKSRHNTTDEEAIQHYLEKKEV